MSADLQRELVLFSPAVADGELYRLLTSAFLHYGLTHILFNMWALYVVGPPLEMALGRLRFTALVRLERTGRIRPRVPAVIAGRPDRGCFGCGVRPVRRDIRGGQAAQPRRPLGHRTDRAQPGLHVRDPVGQFAEHQLAGSHRRTRHRRGDRRGVRICAAATPQPRPGWGDGRGAAAVRDADLVAHGRPACRCSAWPDRQDTPPKFARCSTAGHPSMSAWTSDESSRRRPPGREQSSGSTDLCVAGGRPPAVRPEFRCRPDVSRVLCDQRLHVRRRPGAAHRTAWRRWPCRCRSQ